MSEIMFPPEIWIQIVDHLFMPDLRELSLCSKLLYQICGSRLQIQQRLASEWRELTIWTGGQRPQRRAGSTYHDALFHILEGKLPPSYVFDFTCGDAYFESFDQRYAHSEKTMKHEMQKYAVQMRPLVRAALHEASWIADWEEEDFTDAICRGSEEETLCLLIPLLTNLRALTPPDGMFLGRVIGRIARASQVRDDKIPPLSKLLVISFRWLVDFNIGSPFDQIVPYAALPSVRRLNIHGGTWNNFGGWPGYQPLSCADEVYLRDSSASKEIIRSFAQGFTGPCTFRQLWSIWCRVTLRIPNPDWDLYEIGFGDQLHGRTDKDGYQYVAVDNNFRDENLMLQFPKLNVESVESESEAPYPEDVKSMIEEKLHDWKAVLHRQESGQRISPLSQSNFEGREAHQLRNKPSTVSIQIG